jgi:DNA topoisomerase-3
VNNAKVTDHHAILPTEEPADFRDLSGPEQNIYDLVARRFLAVLLPPYSYEEMELTLDCGGETLTAKGRRVLEEGWHAAYGSILPEEEEDEEEKSQNLPELKQGDTLRLREVKVTEGKTSPPARYTEAALLTAMEHPSAQGEDKRTLEETGGLGTPATRADIIEKLLSAAYVERTGKTLVPTSKGVQLMGLVPQELRSPLLTAKWENRLSAIAAGKEAPEPFIREMRAYAARLVTEVKAAQGSYRHDNATKERCPDCGRFLLAVTGKKGNKMLVCPDRNCGYRKSLSVLTNARCPNCHKKLELRGEGDKRMFTCVCGYREKLSDFEKRREDRGAGKRDVQKYMASQERGGGNTALADALKKWAEQE